MFSLSKYFGTEEWCGSVQLIRKDSVSEPVGSADQLISWRILRLCLFISMCLCNVCRKTTTLLRTNTLNTEQHRNFIPSLQKWHPVLYCPEIVFPAGFEIVGTESRPVPSKWISSRNLPESRRKLSFAEALCKKFLRLKRHGWNWQMYAGYANCKG